MKRVSNRLHYTLITIIAVLFVAVAVYALTPGVAPNPGHVISNVAPPSACSSGQFLKWDGTAWVCGVASATTDKAWTGTSWLNNGEIMGCKNNYYDFKGAIKNDNGILKTRLYSPYGYPLKDSGWVIGTQAQLGSGSGNIAYFFASSGDGSGIVSVGTQFALASDPELIYCTLNVAAKNITSCINVQNNGCQLITSDW